VKNGAIIAYVTKAAVPKRIAKNYLSLYISHDSYDKLNGETEKFHCYHFDSLLTHQRQYNALKASSNLKLS
jgi:DNA replication protein DnaC